MAVNPIPNEAELLAKIADGDQHAFTQLFNWYYKPMGQRVFALVESTQLAQDIVQEAFVKIWLRRETLPDLENFRGYLFIICRNLTFDTLKRLAKERQLAPAVQQHLEWESELDTLDNPSEHYRNLIHQAVDKLPVQQRKIYLLSRHDRLNYEQIGAQLDISPDTVKTQVYNAVKFIRKELSSQLPSCIIVVLTSVLHLGR
jgi:RNA polymerase sigma-70 factor (family 1)